MGVPSFQLPLGTWAARLRRQAALGYAPAPVLRTKPSESLPHPEEPQFRARHESAVTRLMGGVSISLIVPI
jgi:hypothetical protein